MLILFLFDFIFYILLSGYFIWTLVQTIQLFIMNGELLCYHYWNVVILH